MVIACLTCTEDKNTRAFLPGKCANQRKIAEKQVLLSHLSQKVKRGKKKQNEQEKRLTG
jgi:hypothetical protein